MLTGPEEVKRACARFARQKCMPRAHPWHMGANAVPRRAGCGGNPVKLGSADPLETFRSMMALFWLIDRLLSLYIWAVILSAVFSMLASFGVLDTRNRIVWTIGDFLYRVTEPALRPIRNVLPNFGSIDISPVILILLLQAARMLLGELQMTLFRSLY